MLAPKRVQHRKVMKGRRRGQATRGNFIAFGDYGLEATECGWITAQQIEAARIAITRHVKRGGKVWIRVFPDKPFTKKPAETRMGKGKGSPEGWVAVIRPGLVLYEMAGVEREVAQEAMRLAAHKLPLRTKFVERENIAPLSESKWAKVIMAEAAEPKAPVEAARGGGRIMKAADLRDLTVEELEAKQKEVSEELFNLNFQHSRQQLDNTARLGQVRRDLARIKTVLNAKAGAQQ